jgi:hypothetical protein
MESRDQRIANLATTLKSSGIAKSDSQARMMAEEMIGVEEHVQKSYEAEHARAQEFLSTAKNLGTRPKLVQVKPIEQLKERIEPLPTKTEPAKAPVAEVVYTDINYGSKTLSQAFKEHDTHNSAIESIKAQVQAEQIIPLEDMQQPELHMSKEPEVQPEALEMPEPVQETIVEPEPVQEPEPEQKLDADKLVEMMEEDGKLEEHTREIKEKPKDVKPKESYEENNIDISNMFNFGKR